jgi:hypothetical protein
LRQIEAKTVDFGGNAPLKDEDLSRADAVPHLRGGVVPMVNIRRRYLAS